jgi:hypothetical protein
MPPTQQPHLFGDFSDLPDGTVRLDLSDGSSALYSDRGADAHLIWQRAADGSVFSDYQDNDPAHPGHVQFPDGTSGDYHYLFDGRVELDLSDGSQTVLSGSGSDAHILTQTNSTGDVYSNFDAQGHPHHVVFHG